MMPRIKMLDRRVRRSANRTLPPQNPFRGVVLSADVDMDTSCQGECWMTGAISISAFEVGIRHLS